MEKTKRKRLVIPASIAVTVISLAGACQPSTNSDDPCTKAYGPDCVAAETADGGYLELPDGGFECLC